MSELDRVLKPQGSAVVLTGEVALIKETLRDIPHLRVAQSYPVTILGQRATIFVLSRPR